ncbi:hypothetical protein CNY89_16300, partial [Amaricoccus sp. HAR-UPW-R2A-40]
HRHALMTMIAYAFLQSRRLKAAGREKKSPRTAPRPTMPAVRQAILDASRDHYQHAALIVKGSSQSAVQQICQSSARLRTHNQKMTVAAMQMALMKAWAQ